MIDFDNKDLGMLVLGVIALGVIICAGFTQTELPKVLSILRDIVLIIGGAMGGKALAKKGPA